MNEDVILEEKNAKLTTSTLTIKGESFPLSSIKFAESQKGFFNIGLKIVFNNGKERIFKRFISVPSSMALDIFCSYGSANIAYITSRQDLWANSINAQIQRNKEPKTLSKDEEIKELNERIRKLEEKLSNQ